MSASETLVPPVELIHFLVLTTKDWIYLFRFVALDSFFQLVLKYGSVWLGFGLDCFLFFVNFTLEKRTCLHGCFCFHFYAVLSFYLWINVFIGLSACMPHLCAHWFPFSFLCCSSLWLLKMMMSLPSSSSSSIWRLSVVWGHCRNVHFNKSDLKISCTTQVQLKTNPEL